MTDRHPYTPSQGAISQMINQFRKNFPQTVNSEILRKLGIAPNNEGRHINLFKFLGFLDQEGNKTDVAQRIFNIHVDEEFKKEFGKQVALSYPELFDLYKDASWSLSQDRLIGFFRGSDGSTSVVGKKQAQTFQALAAIAGYGDASEVRSINRKPRMPGIKRNNGSVKEKPAEKVGIQDGQSAINEKASRDVGLTVRIEINLPSDGNQETYDRIFKSIRDNLLNE